MRIRDPIHGTLSLSARETAVVDTRHYQRLRNVRQLGFGEMAFPGATHTRHAHALGAMHVSGRLFGAVAAQAGLPPPVASRFSQAVRVAVLCHDLGHMPLSHASEKIAPSLSALRLPSWLAPREGRASHEHVTAKLLLDSPLTEVLRAQYGPEGIAPEAIAALVLGGEPPGGFDFTHAGVDWSPLLRALVSGELDADRMDYLLRDSFYTGVNYGRYDLDWIIQNLFPAEKEGRMHLALSRAATFAFEDFLLSRYHMFVSVYFHHTAANFDYMLGRFYAEAPDEFVIPADPDRFLLCDDVSLAMALRQSKNPWAQRIVARQGFKLLAQFTERDRDYDLSALEEDLRAAQIEHFSVESKATLSKYVEEGQRPSLYILDEPTQRLTEVERYTPLYQYNSAVRLQRVFVRPDQLREARQVLSRHVR